MTTATRLGRPVGELLRDWRLSRRKSQLDLSVQTGVSTRHLSFVETGRSRPSPELIIRLAEQLDVPLPERNTMLLAGGYAPAYPSHELSDPQLAPVRAAVRQILDAHSPYPALLVDRHWHLVDANPAVSLLTAGADADLLRPPVNVLRLSLHPRGMAPRISNLAQWREHLLHRLHRQIETTNDPVLADLYAELRSLPGASPASEHRRAARPEERSELAGSPASEHRRAARPEERSELAGSPASEHRRAARPEERSELAGTASTSVDEALAGVVVPLSYRHGEQTLSLLSTTTVFGTPLDVTVAGLAIEAFFPANPATADALRALV